MRSLPALAACALALAACGGGASDSADSAALGTGDTMRAASPTPGAGDSGAAAGGTGGATAVVRDSAGRELGTLTLADAGRGIEVTGTLRGLPPGEHAIHLHTTGQCQPPFESAGGHWNPTNAQHGTRSAQGPHLGDMPNVTVGADSSATVRVSTTGGSVRGAQPLLDADGGAVVVHASADDQRSQPAGNAGARIACGVVEGR